MEWKIISPLLVLVILQPSFGLRCGVCHEVEHISKCLGATECDSQECFLLISNHGNGNHKYTAGCGSIAVLKITDKTILRIQMIYADGEKNIIPSIATIKQTGFLTMLLKRAHHHGPVCSKCCTSEMCNTIHPTCDSAISATTLDVPTPDTSTATTTYETPQTVTTTTRTTTFDVPKPETTLKTTYATPSTANNLQATSSVLQKGVKCETCAGPTCGLLAGNDPIVLCADSAPYCMNTIWNKEDGTKRITKSCADKYACDNKWWLESSDRSVCTNFKLLNVYSYNFTCSYCCTQDDCNRDVIPSRTTLYKGDA